jgi:CubicO group peptidase (beta-lactamase class C family)
VGGAALEGLAQRHVLEPLGMAETMFLPGRRLRRRIPPTEFQAEQRRGLIHGQVHDGNAWAMGGVAPHAGLFGTAADLGRFLRMILNGGVYEGKQVFSKATIRRFTSRADLAPGSSRALGWDTVSKSGSSAGTHFSARSFGHTGFTGTSVWVDSEQDVGVVLLTNRVHPSRENEGIRSLRPEFHDAVMDAVIM